MVNRKLARLFRKVKKRDVVQETKSQTRPRLFHTTTHTVRCVLKIPKKFWDIGFIDVGTCIFYTFYKNLYFEKVKSI